MEASPTPPDRPNSKPPYLFLVPVLLGSIAFIGYQTVRIGTDAPVERTPYVIDTSVAQAIVRDGVITVHSRRNRAPQRVAVAAHQTPKPTASAAASATPSPTPGASASALATQTPQPQPTVAATAHHRAVKLRDDDTIATEPVPHIRHTRSPRAVAYAAAQAANPPAATAPPITDVPIVRTDTASAAPVRVATAAPTPIEASGRVVDAKMSYAAAPEYPEIARDQGVRGTSVVYVTVDGTGSIVHVSIASTSGSELLDRAALSAARNSRYVPPTIDGKPATQTYRITYDFTP